MNLQRGMSRLIAAALVSGGVAAGVLVLANAPRAQTTTPSAPAAAPETPAAAPAPGTIATTAVPYYADWTSSPHARATAEAFTHWNKEGHIPAECARCHSTPGFVDFLGADGTAMGKVDHPAPVGTVISCVACHNDKAMSLASVTFPSGVKVEKLGSEARCMTCHQGRESTDSVNKAIAGLDDDTVAPKLGFINVHYAAAGATLYGSVARGGYQYAGKSYAGRFQHREPYTRCGACHELHALDVKFNDCAACHKEVTDKPSLHKIRVSKLDRDGNGSVNDGAGEEIADLRGRLLTAIMDYARTVSKKSIAYDSHAYPYFFADNNANGKADKEEAKFPNRFQAWTPRLLKAAYNYQFVTKDPGAFAHNPVYAAQLLLDSLADLGSKVKVDIARAARP